MKSSQNKYWLLVIVAACFEVLWVMGLKHAESLPAWAGTIVAIIVSFLLLIYTAKKLPTSTAYAVFVGLGTVGTVLVEMTVFGEPFRWSKIGLVAVLLIGIIGLKMVTHDGDEDPLPKKEGEPA
ncbi:QacE family quaternary ammonium compound efflux SMR transporter [Paenibacillus sp. 1011MAR3C5]|uniref:DMT family transporter n=1 Tax=Paenibacillus sp. 1011MAR3C5 TaxID=1675787 RepID=UPI000E6C7A91|nr:multidrug efflux SMR transporter [Paenibacillus sp. 1011MAR3C5]RJE90222.1 QacE family quaternary ammonium compound efflux SMR transporter [Paenibacillus sp. 1011MAR3C5]